MNVEAELVGRCTIRGFRSRVDGHMRFGISTHLFHEQRLSRDHLAQIAAHGFEAVEVFATRSHFDYHDPAAIAQLGEWLKETGLALHGIHAPIIETHAAAGISGETRFRTPSATARSGRRRCGKRTPR